MESNIWVFTSQITPEFLLQKNQAWEKVLKLQGEEFILQGNIDLQ